MDSKEAIVSNNQALLCKLGNRKIIVTGVYHSSLLKIQKKLKIVPRRFLH